MRAKSVLSIISKNREKQVNEDKAKRQEELNKRKELELVNAKKAQELKEQERELKDKELAYLENKKSQILDEMKEFKNPFLVSFSGDELIAGAKYIELKNKVERVRKQMHESRSKVIDSKYILLSKLSATLFFIFILVRLTAENRELIESFTFINIFQSVLGESDFPLMLDFFAQDTFLISAISFAIALGFRDYKSFFEKDTRTKLYILFCSSIVGLFCSSLLFSY